MKQVKEKVKNMLKEFEGLSLRAYKDTLGNWTIGYGHKLREPINIITHKRALEILDEDIELAIGRCRAMFKSFDYEPCNIKVFLILMSFNMGYNLTDFRKANKALFDGKMRQAKREYRDSLWSKQVSKDRVNKTLRLLNWSKIDDC